MAKNINKAKIEALKKQRSLYSKAKSVKDPDFCVDEFFDPNDLIQVKYEMLRRVEKDEMTVTKAVSAFGFSRLSFYRIQSKFKQMGLAGLIPSPRGPKNAHKLSEKIMDFIEDEMKKDKSIRARGLQPLIEKKFKIQIHPRSIERAITRKKKSS
jgi:transposase